MKVRVQLPTTKAVKKSGRIPNHPYKPSSSNFHVSHRNPWLPFTGNLSLSLSLASLNSQISTIFHHPYAFDFCRCTNCGTDLNLSAAYLFPPNAYFEAGNKGTLSFSWVDDSKLRFTKEDKIKPFFETLNYWGIQRKRTKMQCDACGFLVGYIYDDGPPMMQGNGQLGMGPSQAIPRCPRYRFKTKALAISS